jgi:dTDP-4-dehydrorhamnose 3,5-epimerase
VRVVRGSVLDVALDLRAGSPTYGKYFSIVLSEDNHLSLYIPKGFAHGFSVLSEKAVFQYKCDEFYHKESEGGIAWDDSQLSIDWQIPSEVVQLSDKDRQLPELKNFQTPFIL